jgi:alpha-tubulin suppressor-like RCC1 family protein
MESSSSGDVVTRVDLVLAIAQTRMFVKGALSAKRIVDVSCGSAHTAAVTADGLLFTMGEGDNGRLGHGTGYNKNKPTVVRGQLEGVRVTACSAGGRHTAALTQDGEVYTFGFGLYGQLGLGMQHASSLSPSLVAKLHGKRVVAIGHPPSHLRIAKKKCSQMRSSSMHGESNSKKDRLYVTKQ